jgi:hypothetical protein
VLGLVRFEGELGLLCVAFGVRHPERAWQPSVYQVAHRQQELHEKWLADFVRFLDAAKARAPYPRTPSSGGGGGLRGGCREGSRGPARSGPSGSGARVAARGELALPAKVRGGSTMPSGGAAMTLSRCR